MAARVRDVMQVEVFTVDASSHLDVVEKLMREEVIRHLPVVSNGTLVGLLTQRDLFRASSSSLLGLEPGVEEARLARVPVRDVMATQVLTAHPDTSLGNAAELMVRERVGCLPVVEDGRLVGLLSETDCLRHLADLLRREEPAV